MGASVGEHDAGGRDGALMNFVQADQIARAVLYEGYLLYP